MCAIDESYLEQLVQRMTSICQAIIKAKEEPNLSSLFSNAIKLLCSAIKLMNANVCPKLFIKLL